MTWISWLLNSFVEPFFWLALHLIWAYDESSEDSRLSAQFYSSSSTGLLLWMFEKVPHPVIITLIVLGCLTVLGTSVILSCCTCKVLFNILRFLYKYCVYRIFLIIIFVAKQVVRGLLISSLIIFKLSFRVARKLKVLITRSISRYFVNRNQVELIRDRPVIHLRAQGINEIDAAAFHPRRRLHRAARGPHA